MSTVPQQLAALERMSVTDLRRRYAEVFGEKTNAGNRVGFSFPVFLAVTTERARLAQFVTALAEAPSRPVLVLIRDHGVSEGSIAPGVPGRNGRHTSGTAR